MFHSGFNMQENTISIFTIFFLLYIVENTFRIENVRNPHKKSYFEFSTFQKKIRIQYEICENVNSLYVMYVKLSVFFFSEISFMCSPIGSKTNTRRCIFSLSKKIKINFRIHLPLLAEERVLYYIV